MKKFIVPTDFSASADHALDYAVMLAKGMKAEVILIHATEPFEYRFADKKALIGEYNQMIINNADKELHRRKFDIRRKDMFEIKTCLYNGAVVESVMQAADNYSASLIIMGSLGRTGLRRKLFGSKAVAAFTQSKIPVLLVPADTKVQTPRSIALALASTGEELNVLDSVFSIASAFECSTSVTVYTNESEEAVEFVDHSRKLKRIEEVLEKKYQHTDVKAEHVTGSGMNEAMQEYICSNNVDLLAMVTHKRTFFEEIVSRSRTKSMAYCAKVPLLAIPADAVSITPEEEKDLLSASFCSELYEKCGFLFYAVAAADHNITAREVEAVKAIVASRWTELEDSVDEFGTDKALQIISVFDWLREESRSAGDCFTVFEEFARARSNDFSAKLKSIILETAGSIAFSFRQCNDAESVYLDKLMQVLPTRKSVLKA
jgi:nucleotide-binding universal stress UspA family protein